MRGMSLYDDKLFLALSNAHLVALDAKHRQGGVGRGDARRPRQLQRPARRQGQGDRGHGRLLGLRRAEVLHQRLRRRHRRSSCGGSTRWPSSGQPGGDTWGALSSVYRAGGETWITGSYDPDLNLTYWGTAQAKPWMPVSRGMETLDKGLYTSSTVALDVRHRQARVALPARARRSARSRRRLRARARRLRRREAGVHGRQGRRPVEARSQDRQVSRSQGNGVPERLGQLRSPKTGEPTLPRRHPRARGRRSGSTAARAPKAATTGRR